MNISTRRRGRPRFEPNAAQRQLVARTAGCVMTYDDLCHVIINPSTGRAIDKRTLMRAFKSELALRKAKMRALLREKLFEAIVAGRPWAIRYVLANLDGWPAADVEAAPIQVQINMPVFD